MASVGRFVNSSNYSRMKYTIPGSIRNLLPTTPTQKLCENYRFDLAKYRLCINEKRYVAITRRTSLSWKRICSFWTVPWKRCWLHTKFFPGAVCGGLSIRKYAEVHQLNRGSVDYLQKKLLPALAQLLKERDEADGTCRLRSKTTWYSCISTRASAVWQALFFCQFYVRLLYSSDK